MAFDQTKTAECRDLKYDLGTFVVAVNRLKCQVQPFTYFINAVASIISWQYPLRSVIVIPIILFMIIFHPEYLVALFLIPLPLMMFVNLIKKLGTKKAKFSDYNQLFIRKDEPLELVEKRAAMAKAREHLDMYLRILIEIQEICNDISTNCEYFYSLFYWKAWKQALIFYLVIIISIVGLFTVRIRFMVAALVFSLSIFNNGFKKIITDACMHLCDSPSKMTVSKSEIFLGSSDEDEVDDMYQQDLDMQISENIPMEEVAGEASDGSEDLTIRPENKPDSLSHFEPQQEKQREKSGLSFVSKIASSTLASIRRRKPANCHSCNVEFSTILKKRNYCRHCGYSFCSKCCRQRVPKVVFGATAPAAYEERVLVCQSCFAFLMNRMKGANTEIIE